MVSGFYKSISGLCQLHQEYIKIIIQNRIYNDLLGWCNEFICGKIYQRGFFLIIYCCGGILCGQLYIGLVFHGDIQWNYGLFTGNLLVRLLRKTLGAHRFYLKWHQYKNI